MGSATSKMSLALVAAISCLWAPAAQAQDLPRGEVVDRVPCAGDPAQTYALYLPASYSPERRWSLLLAFHPAASGRLMVEKYRAAAEQYGFIVAASNNARNGPYEISMAAAQAMSADVSGRFSIDLRRLYLTGMSGGARVALRIALANPNVAGVVASSAGYPDSQPRDKVAFALFGTAGTEDFNYVEMRLLDRRLSSPHFLAVFEGGHTLPPDEVAFDAIEWLELEAMQSGRRQRDDALVARILAKRRARIAAADSAGDIVYLLQALVRDFRGLADVSADAGRLDELTRTSEIRRALARERSSDDEEARTLDALLALEGQLGADGRTGALMALRQRLTALSRKASADADTPERRQARRVLRAMAAGASARVQDEEYLALLRQVVDTFSAPRAH
jgi:dienelactone hydrolase